jgi:hypothetical protein
MSGDETIKALCKSVTLDEQRETRESENKTFQVLIGGSESFCEIPEVVRQSRIESVDGHLGQRVICSSSSDIF